MSDRPTGLPNRAILFGFSPKPWLPRSIGPHVHAISRQPLLQGTIVGLDVYAKSITAAILPGASDSAQVITFPAVPMKVRRFRSAAYSE
jgi:hypothetical protein